MTSKSRNLKLSTRRSRSRGLRRSLSVKRRTPLPSRSDRRPRRERPPTSTIRSKTPQRRRRSASASRKRSKTASPDLTEDHTSERSSKVATKPTFKGPEDEETLLKDRDELKKIVVNIVSASRDESVKREIVNAEVVTVVRRPGEGTRPLFDRDEIKEHNRRFDDMTAGSRSERFFNYSPVNSSGRRYTNLDTPDESYCGNRERSRERIDSYKRTSRYYDEHRKDRSRDRCRNDDTERNRNRSRSSHRRSDYVVNEDHRSFRYATERRCVDDDVRRRSPIDGLRGYYYEGSDIGNGSVDGRQLNMAVDHRFQDGTRISPIDYPRPDMAMVEGSTHPIRSRHPARSRGIPPPKAPIYSRPTPPGRSGYIPPEPSLRMLPYPPHIMRPVVRPVIRVLAPVIAVRPPMVPVRVPALAARFPYGGLYRN